MSTYWAVWNCISYRIKFCINFCSDLYQSNSCANFTTLSDSFCASLVRSVTVKSNNWNLVWPKLLYTNFTVQKLELYQSLFVEQFIHHSWKILCVINDRSHTFNLWFNTWFYNSEILHTSPSSKHQEIKSFKNFMILVITWMYNRNYITTVRGGSTNAATSNMELFVIMVNGWKFWLYKVLLFIYIFKLFIWRLFYLIARFIVLFYQVTYFLLDARR